MLKNVLILRKKEIKMIRIEVNDLQQVKPGSAGTYPSKRDPMLVYCWATVCAAGPA